MRGARGGPVADVNLAGGDAQAEVVVVRFELEHLSVGAHCALAVDEFAVDQGLVLQRAKRWPGAGSPMVASGRATKRSTYLRALTKSLVCAEGALLSTCPAAWYPLESVQEGGRVGGVLSERGDRSSELLLEGAAARPSAAQPCADSGDQLGQDLARGASQDVPQAP